MYCIGSSDTTFYAISPDYGSTTVAQIPLDSSVSSYIPINDLERDGTTLYAMSKASGTLYNIYCDTDLVINETTTITTTPRPTFVSVTPTNYYLLGISASSAIVSVVDRATSDVTGTYTLALPNTTAAINNVTDFLVDDYSVSSATSLYFRRGKDMLRYQTDTKEYTTSASATYTLSNPSWYICGTEEANNTLGLVDPLTTNLALLQEQCPKGNGLVYYTEFSHTFQTGAFLSMAKQPWKSKFLEWASESCDCDLLYEQSCIFLRTIPPYACAARQSTSTIISTVYGNGK